ncbi:outer membrane beta-barrel protein [Roseicyclus sp. F158]|uniref:Outer membrane beta-barrel protein n=1 Tax=Tropicimonas omnivorans TaxID=3075590 RepID=A0ABU3DC21_9RHOB|nr:outer membrane beta-barrel protein [Roseicyclus sp. F158]MDT0681257.1 outer membrane beta-barrel protein [Roseicyclus sp. F158]
MRNLPIAASAAVLATGLTALPAAAEIELSFYGGVQDAPHSRVEGDDGTDDFNFLADWEGRSGEAPPHYGIRATWWRSANLGFGIELDHSKVYASDDTLEDEGFDQLEMTDGINFLTANVFYRWPRQFASGAITPYVGAGAGLSVPHVEVERNGSDTFEYQVTGPAVALMAGASYALTDAWSVFGEYKVTYSSNTADLDNGGELKTDIVTNALNIGLSYSF